MSFASALLCLNFEDREAVVFRAGVKLSREDAVRIIGCELHVYDARAAFAASRGLRNSFQRNSPMTSAGEAATSYAFSGMRKASNSKKRQLAKEYARSKGSARRTLRAVWFVLREASSRA